MNGEIKPLNLETDTMVKAKPSKKAGMKMAGWFLILILLGVGTGFGLTKLTQPKKPKQLAKEIEGEVQLGDVFGVEDEKVFRDVAEGLLKSGGIDGEGSHRLERNGGVSQYVYLTSSVIDLDQFLNKEVKVWGETFEAQKAGWLMDVGRLEIL